MKKQVIAIDITKNEVKSCGVAYYRLTKDMKEFLELCKQKHNIIGFEWEDGNYNFGVILGDKDGKANS